MMLRWLRQRREARWLVMADAEALPPFSAKKGKFNKIRTTQRLKNRLATT
jgi:hypothetical protein